MQLFIRLQLIIKLYEQPKYMYDNRTYVVEKYIFSLNQSCLCLIIREKVNIPIEFGTTLSISIDTYRYARIEKISFESCNESIYFKAIIDRYFE